jgi:hypothetical protein
MNCRFVFASLLLVAVGGCVRSETYVTGTVSDAQITAQPTPENCWVTVWRDRNLDGEDEKTLKYSKENNEWKDLKQVKRGSRNWNDEISSVQWHVPPGWQAVMYVHKNFKEPKMILIGTGQTEQVKELNKLFWHDAFDNRVEWEDHISSIKFRERGNE